MKISTLWFILTLSIFSCEDGTDGLTSLLNVVTELPGDNCQTGGYKLESGIDRNHSNELEASEVQQTEFICNGTNGTSINQLRFTIVYTGPLSTGSSPKVISTEFGTELLKFNMHNYAEYDSAIMVVDGAKTWDANSKYTVELYDLTNNQPIPNSEAHTNSTTRVRINSQNIINSFPDSEIDVGLRIRSEIDGVWGDSYSIYLFLYK
jgi:hypothetical protein